MQYCAIPSGFVAICRTRARRRPPRAPPTPTSAQSTCATRRPPRRCGNAWSAVLCCAVLWIAQWAASGRRADAVLCHVLNNARLRWMPSTGRPSQLVLLSAPPAASSVAFVCDSMRPVPLPPCRPAASWGRCSRQGLLSAASLLRLFGWDLPACRCAQPVGSAGGRVALWLLGRVR